MRRPVRNDAFARYQDQAYNRQDPCGVCPVCGEYIYWPEEDVLWDENNQICHAVCVEKEDQHDRSIRHYTRFPSEAGPTQVFHLREPEMPYSRKSSGVEQL